MMGKLPRGIPAPFDDPYEHREIEWQAQLAAATQARKRAEGEANVQKARVLEYCERIGELQTQIGQRNLDLENKIASLAAANAGLVEAASELLAVLDVDGPETDIFGDDESVGASGDGHDMPMTFGHVRRLRQALAAQVRNKP